jgi:hypothetical protein
MPARGAYEQIYLSPLYVQRCSLPLGSTAGLGMAINSKILGPAYNGSSTVHAVSILSTDGAICLMVIQDKKEMRHQSKTTDCNGNCCLQYGDIRKIGKGTQ